MAQTGHSSVDEDVIERAARVLRDGAAGYSSASERMKDPELRATLVEMGARRRVLADEVVRQAVESGVWVSHTEGSMEARLQRAWVVLESLVGDELTVLRSVRDAEQDDHDELSDLDLTAVPDEVPGAIADGRDHVATCIAALDALLG
jgi:uncharacterized protein (TIGR02284 family)